ALKLLAVFYSFLVTIGVATNTMIITATASSKNLHGTCNILIACCAFSDILHLIGHLPKIIAIFYGTVDMSSFACCIFQIMPTFGLSAGTFLVLSIAVDRLIAVRSAFFAVKTSMRVYLMV
ncbi:hypothetical protein PFISCL1PPCAC_13178, partial [Pristionchus fissidentatus]